MDADRDRRRGRDEPSRHDRDYGRSERSERDDRGKDARRDRDVPRDRDRRQDRDDRDRDRERERERDRDRGKERDYKPRRSHSRSPEQRQERPRRSRSRSRDRDRDRGRAGDGRRGGSPEWGARLPTGRDEEAGASKGRGSRPPDDVPPGKPKEEEGSGPLAGLDADVTPEEIQMMQAMGIPFTFNSTHGKMVDDDAANAGMIKLKSKRTGRQYMNRRGGFNRALPSERTGEKVVRD